MKRDPTKWVGPGTVQDGEMRKVWLNREDFGLFHQDITPYEYEFFRAHSGAFKRMWQEQTRRFWGVFVNTFEQFIWNYGIMKDFPMKSEDIHEYIDEIIFYIRDQFVDGKASTAKNLIMDSVIVTQNRHCIAMLDKVSYAQNPFYMKETREIFRQLFGPPNSKRTFMKVLCGLPVYIKFAGSAVMLLRRWLDADDIPSEDEDGKNDYFRNIHFQGGRMEEPLSLELALSRFKEKERLKKRMAIEAASIEAVTRYTETGGSKTSGKKRSKYSSAGGGTQTKPKMKTDQGTQTGPEGAAGGTERVARKDLLPAATSKNPAEMDTTTQSGSNSVACGSDSEMLLDSKDKEGGGGENGKKKRKKRKVKTGSSTESKKVVIEAGTETAPPPASQGEEKEGGESTSSDKTLPVSGESKDGKVDGGGGNPTSDEGKEPVAKEDTDVAKENNGEDGGIVKEDTMEESSVAEVDSGVAMENNGVAMDDSVAKEDGGIVKEDKGVANDDGSVAKDDGSVAKEDGDISKVDKVVAKEDSSVAKEPSDREEGQAATGNGRKKLHMCACCGLAETLAKTFKRCQKCRGKPNPKYYCSRECQAKHWKTHRLDHKEE